MKKFLLMLCLLLPCAAFAGDCVNPIGEQYSLGDTVIWFGEAYAPGPPDGFAHIAVNGEAVAHIPYAWVEESCQAALDTDPPLWLQFDDGWLEITNYPRFAWEHATSVD